MALPPDPARTRAERYGRWAETAAVALLACQGFRILGRRCRTHAGEIDIVARRGRLVIACEVKARRRAEPEVVALRQWRRIGAALDAYIARRPALADCDRRFDLVELVAGGLPRHRRDVWRP